MKRKLTNFFLGLGLVVLSLGVTAPVGYALATEAATHMTIASAKGDVCSGAALVGANCGDKGAGINTVVRNVVNLLSVAVGIAAVIMIVIAGLKYVTSGGDTQAVAGAKHTIIYAVVGLIIVALAQVIVKFVLSKT
ncbi:MAG TPA: pilin [Candidatus Saccharimonadales bacterium]|nr:pilin [Candidatus Saccharimonadales bacterium]